MRHLCGGQQEGQKVVAGPALIASGPSYGMP